MILPVYKPPGATPLQALERLRKQKDLGEEKLTYAGRLDPMAEGLLLVLGGPDRFEKERYLGLDKEYEAVVLLGFSSDTGDCLGRIQRDPRPAVGDVEAAVKSLEGVRSRPVPRWSSVPVGGRSLVRQLREGKEAEAPWRDMNVIRAMYQATQHCIGAELKRAITSRILSVQGDFRQEMALADWGCIGEKERTTLVHLRLHTGSGTYVRTLAEELATSLGMSGLLFSLLRTRVGPYDLDSALRLGGA